MRFGSYILCLVAALVSAGCAGYKLGPSNGLAAGANSVSVTPFQNNTFEPRLTDAVTAQVRKEIVREGTFKLSSGTDADIVLTGVVLEYERREVSVSSRDTLTGRDFRIGIVAQVTAMDRLSGRRILDERVSGFTLIRAASDLVSSERQALPLLAADLAKNITARLADGSW